MSNEKNMRPSDASRIQSNADKKGTSQGFKARAQSAGAKNQGGAKSGGAKSGGAKSGGGSKKR